jgi:hypothetical protein
LLNNKSEAIACAKEMPVIPVNKVLDSKRIVRQKLRAEEEEEEERHKGSLTLKKLCSTKR